MQRTTGYLSALGLALLSACTSDSTSSPPGSTAIELREPGAGPVDGTAFQCTGKWPSAWTPCNYPWASTPTTLMVAASADLVQLSFARRPIPVDGGATNVELDLHFSAAQLVAANARAITSTAGPIVPVTTTDATGGWIEPVVASPTAGQRNAGRFSLSFPWGTISGSYDTAPP